MNHAKNDLILAELAEPINIQQFKSPHEIISKNAIMFPKNIAIVDKKNTWTYENLEIYTNQIANALLANGITNENKIGIYGYRDASLIISMIAILKAGASFVILDPSYPIDRVMLYIDIVKPNGIIFLTANKTLPQQIFDYTKHEVCKCYLEVDNLKTIANNSFLKHFSKTNPNIVYNMNQIAYIIFTSGTTGKPKGVCTNLTPLSHFLNWHIQTFEFTQQDHFSMLSGLAHDIILRDIFTPLSIGATLCIPDNDIIGEPLKLTRWFINNKITVSHLTPATGKLLATRSDDDIEHNKILTLRYAFFGGDILTVSDIDQLKKMAPDVNCVNFYGTTETPQAMSFQVVDSALINILKEKKIQAIPVGKGISEAQLVVLNSENKLSEIGENGEIYIRSSYLSLGYLDEDDLTAERFIQNPFTDDVHDRLYKTGDVGRYLPDGTVVHLGRKDNQIKIRGYRIELNEIEVALKNHEKIAQSAVIAVDFNETDKRIIAYYSLKKEYSIQNFDLELKNYLMNILPNYMVPQHFVKLNKFLLTPNGKIDRRALPRPAIEKDNIEVVLPENEVQIKLALIFRTILKIKKFGIHDSFFDLGGNSLFAAQLLQRILESFKIEIPLIAIFNNPTISKLEKIISGKTICEYKTIELLKGYGVKIPVFFIGSTLVAKRLVEFWDSERPMYGINILASNILFDDLSKFTIKNLASKYVDEILSINPNGQFYIWSYCLDQLAAYEVCQEIERRGKSVELLIFIDFARLGRRVYSLKERLRDHGLVYIYGYLKILSKKIRFKLLGISTKIDNNYINRDMTFYENYYKPACIELKTEYLSCPTIIFKSLEWKYLPLPNYIKNLTNIIRIKNMPYLHLPLYREDKSLKKIIKYTNQVINDIEKN